MFMQPILNSRVNVMFFSCQSNFVLFLQRSVILILSLGVLTVSLCDDMYSSFSRRSPLFFSLSSRSSWIRCTSTSRGSTSWRRTRTTASAPRTRPSALTSSPRRPSLRSRPTRTTRWVLHMGEEEERGGRGGGEEEGRGGCFGCFYFLFFFFLFFLFLYAMWCL